MTTTTGGPDDRVPDTQPVTVNVTHHDTVPDADTVPQPNPDADTDAQPNPDADDVNGDTDAQPDRQ
jgi:hypothetical protein